MQRRVFSRLLAGTVLAGGLLPVVKGFALSAPTEFAGSLGWLNVPGPLSIAGLRGKVVLVNFWTYSCINCRRTIPYLNRWQAEYGPQGLQVIGIEAPEFGFERARRNVEEGVEELGIHYPVGQDNGFQTWRAWGVEAWPTFYLLDREGHVVLVRVGEDHGAEMEGAIRGLLGLPGAPGHASDDPDLSRIATPEIYFGSMYPTPQDRAQSPRRGEAAYTFAQAAGPRLNQYELDGTWARGDEALVLHSPRGSVRVHFSAAKLHVVAASEQAAPVRISVNGGPARTIEIGRPTLYTLLDGDTYGEHLLELETETPGLSLFSATFG